MCLLLVAYRSHRDYDIVLAANRDEFHARPTKTAHFWTDYPSILAGRDLQAGGTWLGITKKGRIAAVTNYHEEPSAKSALLSRGALVSDFLRSENSPDVHAHIIAGNGEWYGGFNIILGTADDLFYCSNRKSGFELLEPGIHGISNHLMNDESFKIRKGREAVKMLLSGNKRIAPDDLFAVLNNREKAPDAELPPHSVTTEDERFYSPIFIEGTEYGTRCSTVILIEKRGQVYFSERCFSPAGEQTEAVEYEFLLET